MAVKEEKSKQSKTQSSQGVLLTAEERGSEKTDRRREEQGDYTEQSFETVHEGSVWSK